MSVNSELAALNSVGKGQLGDLPDCGTGTGFQSGGGYAVDETNRVGSIDASSDHHSARCFGIDEQITGSNGKGPQDNTYSFGRIDASSDAPGEENVNDADAGKGERKNYA